MCGGYIPPALRARCFLFFHSLYILDFRRQEDDRNCGPPQTGPKRDRENYKHVLHAGVKPQADLHIFEAAWPAFPIRYFQFKTTACCLMRFVQRNRLTSTTSNKKGLVRSNVNRADQNRFVVHAPHKWKHNFLCPQRSGLFPVQRNHKQVRVTTKSSVKVSSVVSKCTGPAKFSTQQNCSEVVKISVGIKSVCPQGTTIRDTSAKWQQYGRHNFSSFEFRAKKLTEECRLRTKNR